MIGRVFKSKLGQNILFNYLNVVWMGGLSLALIPVYLRKLGPEQWGVVAICMAIQGFLSLLDVGLSQIMPRDVARADGDPPAARRIFAVYERSYLVLGLIGLVAGQLAVPWLIEVWFNKGEGLDGSAGMALRLVLVQFFFQFMNNANTGYWNGIQAQKLANLRQCGFGTLKHLSALTLVFFWAAEPVAYLIPFVAVAFLEWLFNRRTVMVGFGPQVSPGLSRDDFHTLARQAGVLAAGVLIGMLVSQIDRVILSRSAGVVEYGRYVIVANLGLAFLQLQYPLMRALFPRIVLAEIGRGGKTSSLSMYVGVTVLCIAPCVIVAALAPLVLRLWVGDPVLVAEGTAPLRLILCAVAINTLYSVAYQKLVAQGRNRLVVAINLASLCVVAPLTWVAAERLGIVAGGLAWLASSLIQLGLGLFWVSARKRREAIC